MHAIEKINKELHELGYYIALKFRGQNYISTDSNGIHCSYDLHEIGTPGRHEYTVASLKLYGNYGCCGHGSVASFPYIGGSYRPDNKDTPYCKAIDLFFSGLLVMPSDFLKGCFITATVNPATQKEAMHIMLSQGWFEVHKFTGLHNTPVIMLGAQKKKGWEDTDITNMWGRTSKTILEAYPLLGPPKKEEITEPVKEKKVSSLFILDSASLVIPVSSFFLDNIEELTPAATKAAQIQNQIYGIDNGVPKRRKAK